MRGLVYTARPCRGATGLLWYGVCVFMCVWVCVFCKCVFIHCIIVYMVHPTTMHTNQHDYQQHKEALKKRNNTNDTFTLEYVRGTNTRKIPYRSDHAAPLQIVLAVGESTRRCMSVHHTAAIQSPQHLRRGMFTPYIQAHDTRHIPYLSVAIVSSYGVLACMI